MTENNKETPDWKIFEKIADQIHKSLLPKAEVVLDDSIPGHDSKQPRQIDISIRQHLGPYPTLIIVQCRHYKNKIDLNDVEQFVSVIKDIRANAGVIISNAGFTEGAISLARDQGISLCSIFDAENKDWSVLIQFPVICDFRFPIIRERVKGRMPKAIAEQLQADINSVEFVKSNGETIGARGLFSQDWNAGRVKFEAGEHVHTPSESNLSVRSADGKLWPVEVTFYVEVQSRFFFGHVGIEKGDGVVNVLEHSFTTKDMILKAIHVADVEKSWKQISKIEEAPERPFITLVALDTFPSEGTLSLVGE